MVIVNPEISVLKYFKNVTVIFTNCDFQINYADVLSEVHNTISTHYRCEQIQ